MKISIIVQSRFHAFDLAREFHRRDCLHQLITPYPRYIAQRFGVPPRKVTSLIGFEIFRRIVNRLPLGALMQNWTELRWLELYAKEAARALEKCDILLAWSSVGSAAFAKANKWGTICICERGSSHILTQERLLSEEHHILGLPWVPWTDHKRNQELVDYKQADFIAVPSHFARSSFIDHGFSEQHLIHSPYGVDIGLFRKNPSSSNTLFRVISVGSLTVRKGIHYLEEGFKLAGLSNSEMLLVGARSSETELLLSNNDPRIRLLGPVPQRELPELYAKANVFVLASIEEGLAMVQAQALACGLPIICTTNTGGEDLLRLGAQEPLRHPNDILQYPAGFVVPIRRPDCIAYCLRILYDNKKLQEQMSTEALKISNQGLDWSHTAARLIDKYRSILSDNSTRKEYAKSCS